MWEFKKICFFIWFRSLLVRLFSSFVATDGLNEKRENSNWQEKDFDGDEGKGERLRFVAKQIWGYWDRFFRHVHVGMYVYLLYIQLYSVQLRHWHTLTHHSHGATRTTTDKGAFITSKEQSPFSILDLNLKELSDAPSYFVFHTTRARQWTRFALLFTKNTLTQSGS